MKSCITGVTVENWLVGTILKSYLKIEHSTRPNLVFYLNGIVSFWSDQGGLQECFFLFLSGIMRIEFDHKKQIAN